MISEIKIMPLSDAIHASYSTNLTQDLWISVVDIEDELKLKKLKARFRERGVKAFGQVFRDWSDEDPEDFIKARIEIDGPQESHINNIISFIEPYIYDNPEHKLGINCLAGVSRSTAVGVIALVMGGLSVEHALAQVLKIRAVAWPNLRMLRLASVRLGKDIHTYVANWKKEKSHEFYYGPKTDTTKI